MSVFEWPGFFVVFIVGLIFALGIFQRFFPRSLSGLVLLGYLMRAVGSLLRYVVIFMYYTGGDAGMYYRYGASYASLIWNMDFSFFKNAPDFGNLGTQILIFFTGFVIAIFGPTRRGSFLAFSIIAFIGLLYFLKTFQRNYPEADPRKYARWLFLWPSLWFWPGSIGKDALILVGISMVAFGYCGNKIRWIYILAGLFITGMIRPHVASVIIMALCIGHWLSGKKILTAKHLMQGALLLALAGFVLLKSASRLGVDTDLQGVAEFGDTVREHSSVGGSTIEAPGVGILSIPMAFVNVLCRPFPWEASSVVTAAAALEIVIFWCVVFKKRKRIFHLLKEWRTHKTLRFALPFTVLYVLMLGMVISNLGIIARQRIHIWPLLFLWFEAVPNQARMMRNRPQHTFQQRPAIPLSKAV